jgi:hypothetical protein
MTQVRAGKKRQWLNPEPFARKEVNRDMHTSVMLHPDHGKRDFRASTSTVDPPTHFCFFYSSTFSWL